MTSTMIWYELLTSDPDAAAPFYGAVLGWTVTDSGQAGMDYRLLNMKGVGVGGLMKVPPDAAKAGMPPNWRGYVSVPDVDESVAAITKAGGAVHMPAMTVPNVGRMAMVADPQGAGFYVMTPAGTGTSRSFEPGTPGHGGWQELHTTNWEAAFDFYRTQFGWQKVDTMDMGPMGKYLLFNFGSGDSVGGMLNSANTPRPHWLYYFNVDDIQPATDRITANGGQAFMGPHEVPGGSWITQARDPQGALFAIVGPKR